MPGLGKGEREGGREGGREGERERGKEGGKEVGGKMLPNDARQRWGGDSEFC